MAERSKARAWKVRIRQKRIVGSNPTPSASFSSRTGARLKNGLRFFEGFAGNCEGDRTSETEERPKNGSLKPFYLFSTEPRKNWFGYGKIYIFQYLKILAPLPSS